MSRLIMATLPWRQALTVGLLLAGLGTWLGLSPWQKDIEALERVQSEVARLETKLEQAVSSAVNANLAMAPLDNTRPREAHSQAVWSWLQQRLQAHGLQVQTLRPGAVERVAGLPEQELVLEVLGRWVDWLAFEQALDRHAPWWTVTQWQVVPGATHGQVRVRWHVRWAWRPDAPGHDLPLTLPVWSPSAFLQTAADVFESPGHASATTPEVEQKAGAAEPSWRLLGIWHQHGVPHAVLAYGLEQFVLAPGQRNERLGHRLVRVGSAEAVLQLPDRAAPPLRLVLKGDPQ